MDFSFLLGFTGGVIASSLTFLLVYLYKKIKDIIFNMDILGKKIDELDANVIPPEEMAKTILNMKVPLSDLSPEMYEQVKNDALAQKKSSSPEYFG